MAEPADPLEQHPERLRDLRVPALVAAGGRDLLDFREAADLLARSMPHARHALIEGAGHLAPLETPQAFRELLIAFLRRLAPAAQQ